MEKSKQEQVQKEAIEDSSRYEFIETRNVTKWMKERWDIIKQGRDISEQIERLVADRTKLEHKANKLQGKIVKWSEQNIVPHLAEYEMPGDIKLEDGGVKIQIVDHLDFFQKQFKKRNKK